MSTTNLFVRIYRKKHWLLPGMLAGIPFMWGVASLQHGEILPAYKYIVPSLVGGSLGLFAATVGALLHGQRSAYRQQREEADSLLRELRMREERLELATKQLSIWDWNILTDELYLSPEFPERLGYTSEEFEHLKQGSVANFLHEDDREPYRAKLKAHLADPSQPLSTRHRFQTKSGDYVWHMALGQASLDDRGQPARFVGVTTDITEFVRAQNEAEESRRTLVSAVEHSADAFSLWDANDRLIFGNRKFRETNAFVGKRLVPGLDFKEFLHSLYASDLMMSEEPDAHAFVDDMVQWMHGSQNEPKVHFRTQGKVMSLRRERFAEGFRAVFGREITAEYQKTLALAQSERRLRDAQKRAHLGYWELDREGNLLWSDEALIVFGVSAEDFDGSTDFFYKLVHPSDRQRLRDEEDAPWERGQAYDTTYRILRNDGSERILREIAEVILDEADGVLKLVGTVQDVTDRLMLEAQLRQAQKMEAIGNLTGGVAHDFNNLLAVILGNLELIQSETDLDEIQQSAQDAILAAERGADLTKSLLSFAQQSHLEPAPVDLNALLGEAENWWRRVLPENITVTTRLADGLRETRVDTALLQNVVLNLVLNARDAMPSGGALTIETSNLNYEVGMPGFGPSDLPEGAYAVLTVQDTGTGIPQEIQQTIFEPFFTTKAVGAGSGLGLSMVQGFMQQSGGAVHVMSEIGAGTTFKLLFPAQECEPALKATTDRGKAEPSDARHARILLVEDEPAVLKILEKTLSRAGYSLNTATSGDRALASWEQDDSYDLVITDIVMPGVLQGVDLANELRTRRPDVPVIFLTGYAPESGSQGTGLGPDDVRLMKPVAQQVLLEAIEAALRPAAQN